MQPTHASPSIVSTRDHPGESTYNGAKLLEKPVRLYRDPKCGRMWALEASVDLLAIADPEWCWVQEVEEALVWIDTSAAFPIGVVVVAHSLSTAKGANLNGVLGTVTGYQGDRVRVQFPDCEKALQPVNLGATRQRCPSSHMRYGDGQISQVPVPRTRVCLCVCMCVRTRV